MPTTDPTAQPQSAASATTTHRIFFNRAEILQALAPLPATAHLTSQEAAVYINTTPEVLRVWRSIGKGPRFRGRGHFVRYSKGDLDAFMAGFDHRFEEDPA